MSTVYMIAWLFDVWPEHSLEFENQYGLNGAWAKLFSKSQEYLGTRLLQDTEHPHRYVTFDFWKSEAAFQEFNDRFGKEYKALDLTFGYLTVAETRLGAFSSEAGISKG